jgi:hypothetical protein
VIRTARKRWIAAWLGGAAIGVANGVAREATYGRVAGERTAHNLSGVTGIASFAGYYWALQRRWPLANRGDAVVVGASWLALTVAFEFGFGRLVAKQSWDELLADYDVAEGRTWPFVLAWIAVGPAVVRELQQPR